MCWKPQDHSGNSPSLLLQNQRMQPLTSGGACRYPCMMLCPRTSPGHRKHIPHLLLQFLHKKLESVTNSDMPWKRWAVALREMEPRGGLRRQEILSAPPPLHNTHTHTHTHTQTQTHTHRHRHTHTQTHTHTHRHTQTHTHTHIHTTLGSLSLTNSSDFVFLRHHLTFQ